MTTTCGQNTVLSTCISGGGLGVAEGRLDLRRPLDRSIEDAGSSGPPPIAVLYENDEWMEGLFAALKRRGLAYKAIQQPHPQNPNAPGTLSVV